MPAAYVQAQTHTHTHTHSKDSRHHHFEHKPWPLSLERDCDIIACNAENVGEPGYSTKLTQVATHPP